MCRSSLDPGHTRPYMAGQVLFVDGGADTTLRSDQPYADGITYGPVTMARMLYWSIVARWRARRSRTDEIAQRQQSSSAAPGSAVDGFFDQLRS